jgi:hypothetical protein
MRLPRILLLTLVFAAFAGLTTARAATAPAAPQALRFDGGLAMLDGPCQFHLGDDSAWARPGFDDASWEKLDPGKPRRAQGHAGVDGYARDRRNVGLAPGWQDDITLLTLCCFHSDRGMLSQRAVAVTA